jgi:hypothetical protein
LYRIALLVNDTDVSGLVADLIDWAQGEPDIEICALVIHPHPAESGAAKLRRTIRRDGVYSALSKIAYAVLQKVESALLLPARQRALYASHPVGERVATHVRLDPQVSASGFIHRFSAADVARVRALNADLLIRTGTGILRGDILSAARHGVMSMHHGDNRINRGGPPGFWEVLERQPATGFIVQRLEAEVDGGEVLYRGSFLTQMFFMRNQAALYERSQLYLKRTIRALLEGRVEAEDRLLYANRLYRSPPLHAILAYALKTFGLAARIGWRRLAGRTWRWGVSYVPGEWRRAVLWRARRIPNPPRRFLADPFAIEQDGRHYIFVEDYCYRAKRAGISAYRVEPGKSCTRLGVAIDEPFHLSFPSLFRHEGALYMVPESAENGDIRLYRCVEFPLKWELHKVLMTDVRAVDTLVFAHDGRWWMLTNINPIGHGLNDAELCLFHAASPLGEWTPHPGNPVVLDAMKGRNGGLLADAGGLYRVAQRPAFHFYGKGVGIYRIETLDERAYRETLVQEIDPAFRRGLSGLHHLHQDAGLVVFDHVRAGWTRGQG